MDNNVSISPDEVISDTDVTPTAAAPESNVSSNLQNAMWGDPVTTPAPDVTNPEGQAQTPPPATPDTPPAADEEILEEDAFVKKYFEGFTNVESVKKEIETLRSKSQTPAEIKFENEFSDKLFKAIQAGKTKEVTKMLAEQERIEEIVAKEVSENTAEDFIKMGMQLKYKDLSPKEIEYKFNKDFGIPKEPVQKVDELDEDFAERKAAWEEKVNDIKMNRIIEAKLLKPEIEKSKSNIVFPEVPQNNGAEKKPTQEELDAFKKHQDSFIQAAQSNIDSFNGFSVQVKDKDVDYAVSYDLSQEEKALVNNKLKEFAEQGFNANALLADRWVNEDGTLKVDLMVKDLSKIYSDDKVSHKLVSDAANKRLEIYLKEKKNININNTPSGQFAPEAKTESERLQEQFWGN